MNVLRGMTTGREDGGISVWVRIWDSVGGLDILSKAMTSKALVVAIGVVLGVLDFSQSLYHGAKSCCIINPGIKRIAVEPSFFELAGQVSMISHCLKSPRGNFSYRVI